MFERLANKLHDSVHVWGLARMSVYKGCLGRSGFGSLLLAAFHEVQELLAVVDVQLAVEAAHVGGDGAVGKHQLVGDADSWAVFCLQVGRCGKPPAPGLAFLYSRGREAFQRAMTSFVIRAGKDLLLPRILTVQRLGCGTAAGYCLLCLHVSRRSCLQRLFVPDSNYICVEKVLY